MRSLTRLFLLGRRVSYNDEEVREYYRELCDLVIPVVHEIAGSDYCLADYVKGTMLELAYQGPPSEEAKKRAMYLALYDALDHLSSHLECWGKYLTENPGSSDGTDLSLRIREVFSSLDPSSRQILARTIIDKERLESIAEDLHIPVDRVYQMLQSANYKVRRDLVLLHGCIYGVAP